MDLASRLDGRPVFVTGADGFVGSHLVDLLVNHGADTHAFVRAKSPAKLRNIGHCIDDLTLHHGNLQDRHSVESALQTLSGESDILVFHLGAQAHVGQSWERPYETIETNVIGTLHLLHSVLELDLDVSSIEVAGTSEEYGNIDTTRRERYETDEEGRVLLDETSPINPMSVYATSKVTADFLARNYYDAYGLPTVVTRMFNNYGPRQSPRYITGTIVTQALTSDHVELGNLTPKRDMCYVTDGVRGHLYTALEGEPGDRYPFGYGENVSMQQWANMILEIGTEHGYWEKPQIVQVEERFRPGDSDVEELRARYDKLHQETGWEPEVSWEEGIHRTIEWYASNRAQWDWTE